MTCPVGDRIRAGMLEKKCGGMLGALTETWKPRLAVLAVDRLTFGSQEHAMSSRESDDRSHEQVCAVCRAWP